MTASSFAPAAPPWVADALLSAARGLRESAELLEDAALLATQLAHDVAWRSRSAEGWREAAETLASSLRQHAVRARGAAEDAHALWVTTIARAPRPVGL